MELFFLCGVPWAAVSDSLSESESESPLLESELPEPEESDSLPSEPKLRFPLGGAAVTGMGRAGVVSALQQPHLRATASVDFVFEGPPTNAPIAWQ